MWWGRQAHSSHIFHDVDSSNFLKLLRVWSTFCLLDKFNSWSSAARAWTFTSDGNACTNYSKVFLLPNINVAQINARRPQQLTMSCCCWWSPALQHCTSWILGPIFLSWIFCFCLKFIFFRVVTKYGDKLFPGKMDGMLSIALSHHRSFLRRIQWLP